MQNLVISIKEDSEIKPLILSSSIIVEGESAESCCDSISFAIEKGAHRLKRWREVISNRFPTAVHDIPSPEEMSLSKLRQSVVSTDACNAARKTRRLLMEKVK